MPPLLKSLSTHATNPVRNLVLLSKSEWFCGLGAGLNLSARGQAESALDEMSKPTEITYKRLASLLATKQYNVVISFIRCRLSFSLLRSAIMCLRSGSRQERIQGEGHK